MAKNRRQRQEFDDEWGAFEEQDERKRNRTKGRRDRTSDRARAKDSWFQSADSVPDPDYGFDNDF